MLELELTKAQAETLRITLYEYLNSLNFEELEPAARHVIDGDLSQILNQLEQE
jgi:hypothetical protein